MVPTANSLPTIQSLPQESTASKMPVFIPGGISSAVGVDEEDAA
jgi:hypothetical protein